MNKDNTLNQIENDYSNELKRFLGENFLLDENYFIDFKLKGLQTVIKKYEEVGEFFIGDDEFKFGKKSSNRSIFGYYYLYSKFLISRKEETNKTVSTRVGEIDLEEDFKFIKNFENEKVNPYNSLTKKKDKKLNANFIIGLKFATGEVYKYLDCNKLGNYVVKENSSFDDITEKLKLNLTLRPFISETVNNSQRHGSKNIFKDKKVMLLIKKHCNENRIIMCQEFINQLEKIQEY